FLLFGRLASEEHTIPDYLNEIQSGGKHERWMAAYQLSKSLKRGEAKKYPDLEQKVASIYVAAKNDDPRIRRYLSMVLGNIGDRRALGVLREMLDRSRLDRVPGMRPDQKEDAMVVAISAYRPLAGGEGRAELAQLAKNDPSLRVQAAAKDALKSLR